MMNMKKSFIILLVAMLMTVVFVGCSSSNNNKEEKPATEAENTTPEPQATPEPEKPADPVTIKLMQYTASGSQEETLDEMVKAFESANPDIKVDVEVVAYGDYYTKLSTLLSGGNAAPDVFELGYENFVTYASKGVLYDLSPVIAADTTFKPDTYKKLAYDAFNYDSKQYGLVESFSDVVMFYNKDLFDAKKVEYPQPSWTWKEELAAAEKLTDAKNGVWGTYSPIQFWEFYKTIAQNGGSIFSSDNKSVTINSKETVEALNWMFDKASKYKVSPPLNDDTFSQPDADLNAFKAGKLAMLRTGIWNFGRFSDAPFKWDIALEPGNTQKAHHFFADGLVVSKDSKNAEAAWKFMKFMTSDPFVVNKRIEKGWSVPAVADEAVMDAYYKQAPPESKKVVTEALDSLVLPPVGPLAERWNDLTSAVGEEIEKAKLGKIDAQKAMDNAKEKLEKLMKE